MIKNNQPKFKQTETPLRQDYEGQVGQIPEDWEVMRLADSGVELIDGDRGNNYPNGSDFSKNDFCLFLNTKNVTGEKFDFSDCSFIAEEKDRQLRKGKLSRGDIVLTTRGTVGNIAFYDDSIKFENIRINSGMLIFRNVGDKFVTSYLYQILKSPYIREQFKEFSSGSAQPQLPVNSLKHIRLIMPSIEEQRKIAGVLGALDEKIELNRKMNKTLEQIGQAIFKEWFADKDNANNWNMGLLGNIARQRKERLLSNEDNAVVLSAVNSGKLVRSDDFFDKRVYSKSIKNYKIVKQFDFAYNPSRINIGSIGMLEEDIVGAVSPVYEVVSPKRNYHYFLLMFLRLNNTKEIIKQFSSGSVRQALSINSFLNIPVNIPPEDLIVKFNKFYSVLLEVIQENQTQIDILSQIRDSLLPRLMSGKLRVR